MRKSIFSILFFTVLSCSIYAQSGAKVSAGVSRITQDFLPTDHSYTGWNLRLSARLGGGVWFFSPELNYSNHNILQSEKTSPFAKNARIHTLQVPLGLGWKFKTTPFQKIFVKGGVIGSYVLVIDENNSIDFNDIVDTYGSFYGTIGYDFYWFTIDYRYEKSFMDNYFTIEDSKLAAHSVTLGLNF